MVRRSHSLAQQEGALAPHSAFFCSLRLLLFQGNCVVPAVDKSYPRGLPAGPLVAQEKEHYYVAVITNGGLAVPLRFLS
jgi:hypothetical protein